MNWQRKYWDHWRERCDPIYRHASCGHCGFQARTVRRGLNSRAALSSLRGVMVRHLKEKHPDEVKGGGR